jgi:SAM-dependent methyltransferase
MKTPRRYLLGDSRREAARLRAQARLWDPTSLALFDRLGIRRGWKILEIGPGQGSLHMELRRRAQGPIDAVEQSGAFAARLKTLCARDGLGPGRIEVSTLMEAQLPRRHYNLIFARWVFLFLPQPLLHLKKLAGALKPGGLIALEDYHRDSFALIPRPPEWLDFIAADRAFFAAQGSDANIGARLPDLYRAAGLEVVEVVPTIMTGRPGSAVWDWVSTYFLGVMNRYAGSAPFTKASAAALRRRWHRAAREKTSLIIAPTVLDVVGRKPAGIQSRDRSADGG